MKKIIWVTGVAGFTGYHLVSFLRQQSDNMTIIGIDLHKESPIPLDAYYSLDLLDMISIKQLAEEIPPDIVFHLAGLLPPRPEAEMWQVNVGGTLNILQAFGELTQTPKFICIGSAAEYLPTASGLVYETDACTGYSGYGRVKWGQTTLAQYLGSQYGIEALTVRPFNLIGPGLPNTLVAAQLCQQFAASNDDEVKVGNTESVRDFIDIRDAVAAYWQVALFGEAGESYNVCSSVQTKIAQIVEIFSELSGGKHKVVFDENLLKKVDADVVFGSYDKLYTISGWKPRLSLKQSLTDMYNEAIS